MMRIIFDVYAFWCRSNGLRKCTVLQLELDNTTTNNNRRVNEEDAPCFYNSYKLTVTSVSSVSSSCPSSQDHKEV